MANNYEKNSSPPGPDPTPNPSESPTSTIKPTRPRIVLPPTTPNIQINPMYTASIPITPGSMSHPQNLPFNLYPTKAGDFMFKQFNGFKDFTMNTAKSGMSFGEKIMFWMYNRVSSLSKRWFTHIFLGIVILLYSVGGAFLFVTIEGRHEEVVLGEMRQNRIDLLEKLKQITLKPPQETTENEWRGDSYRALLDYEETLHDYWSNKALYATNGERNKVWTFWNAIFYCGTIYTTIAQFSRAMGTLQAPTDEIKSENDTTKEENDEKNQDSHRFEGKVTQEQELSAAVAKKRRNISKKRTETSGRPRDVTPARELLTEKPDTGDEETPNVPERKLKAERKTSSNGSNKNSENGENGGQKSGKVDAETNTGAKVLKDEISISVLRSEADEQKEETRELVEIQKEEVISDLKALMEQAKETVDTSPNPEVTDPKSESPHPSIEKKITPTKSTVEILPAVVETKSPQTTEPKAPVRERPARMRKDKQLIKKRSQSTPRPAVEELGSKDDLQEKKNKLRHEKELLETKLKAESSEADNKKLIAEFKHAQILSAFGQETPTEIKDLVSSTETSTVRRRKPLQPAAQQFLERRKLEKKLSQEEDDKKKEEVAKFKFKRMTIGEICGHWRRFKTEFPIECVRITNLRNTCVTKLTLVMILCGFGGLIFKFTEGAFEDFYKCGVKRVKRDFIEILWRGSHNLREEDWKSLARTKLRDFEEQLHNAHEAGVHSYSGQRSWSFLNGIVYCLTVITSIGYGHMYPTTTTGRALTIVYSLIGIPLFLIVLTDFGKLFTRCIKFVWAFVRRVYYTGTCKKARKATAVKEVMKGAQMVYEIATFRRPSQFNIENPDPNEPPKFPTPIENNSTVATPVHTDIEAPETPAPSNFEIDDEFNLPISVALTILVLYMFAGALFYNFWESWDFFASFYFVFISMSTIGFGDYVPTHPICMIASIVYLVFGLALMSMCINVVQLKLSDTFRQASAKLGATIGLRVAEEDGSITTIPPPTVEIVDVHTNSQKDSV